MLKWSWIFRNGVNLKGGTQKLVEKKSPRSDPNRAKFKIQKFEFIGGSVPGS